MTAFRATPTVKVAIKNITLTLPVRHGRDDELINKVVNHNKKKKQVRFDLRANTFSPSREATSYTNRSLLPITNALSTLFSASEISRELVLASITPNTQTSYKTGHNKHLTFTKIMETTADLSQIPFGWESFHMDHPEYRNFRQAYWCALIVYLDRNAKVAPKTIRDYLTGIKWFLENIYFVDTSFTKGPIVKTTLKGITNIWRAQPGNNEADKRRLGIPLDVILFLCNTILTSDDPVTRCGKLFFQLAFQLLARKSELLHFKDNKHYLKVDNVNFTFVKNDNPNEQGISVTSLQAYKINLDEHTLRSVQIEIKDAKNDQEGNSHRYSFDVRSNDIDPTKTYCLANECLKWILISKPTKGTWPFLSHPPITGSTSTRSVPSEDNLRKALKGSAQKLGLDPQRVTLHSIRIGAATTLAAAGATDYTIKNAGRWKSDCFQRYVRDTSHMNEKVADLLLNANAYNVTHVKKWCVAHQIIDDAIFDEED